MKPILHVTFENDEDFIMGMTLIKNGIKNRVFNDAIDISATSQSPVKTMGEHEAEHPEDFKNPGE